MCVKKIKKKIKFKKPIGCGHLSFVWVGCGHPVCTTNGCGHP